MPDLPSSSWEGSNITPAHIDYLRRTRRLPVADLVEARVPRDEISPQPCDDECVVFGAHFLVGFGLPVSGFFRRFMASYGRQMHHLGVNAILYITSFVTLCVGYLGLRPFSSFFRYFFYFHAQKHKNNGTPYSSDGVVVYRQRGPPFSGIIFKDSCKKRQRTFFYVCNLDEDRDWVGLKPFTDQPANEPNWKIEPDFPEMRAMVNRLENFITAALTGADVIGAFTVSRVAPLKAWAHQICDMGGHMDLCRLTTAVLPLRKVAACMNNITNFQLDEDRWQFGMVPYCRSNPVPQVFRSDRSVSDCADYEWDSEGHVTPENSEVPTDTGGHGGEGGEEEPTRDPKDKAQSAHRGPEGPRDSTDDDDDDELVVLDEAPPSMVPPGTALNEGRERTNSAVSAAKLESLRKSLEVVRGKRDEIARESDRLVQ
ncbi:hypothetical protein D1007_47567 [Hordeum vulgare]|nr:hypothetical protein D1007_47567 [Hordeum vulgare]